MNDAADSSEIIEIALEGTFQQRPVNTRIFEAFLIARLMEHPAAADNALDYRVHLQDVGSPGTRSVRVKWTWTEAMIPPTPLAAQQEFVTESAAYGLAFAVLSGFTSATLISTAQRGERFDYILFGRRNSLRRGNQRNANGRPTNHAGQANTKEAATTCQFQTVGRLCRYCWVCAAGSLAFAPCAGGGHAMRRKQETPETIAALDAEKSNLLMEAFVLIGTGDLEQAIERYAAAAPMEERIATFYKRQGDPIMAARSWLSAAVCYAKSGSSRDALRIFDAMGWDRETPGEYKGEVLLWAARLRQQQRDALQEYRQPLQSAA